MILDDRCGALRKFFAADQVAVTVAPQIDQEQIPSGNGYYPINGADGITGPKRFLIIPFGTAAATKTFTMSLYSWRATLGDPTDSKIKHMWIAYPMASFLCTLGAGTGLKGCYVDDLHFFCDTIAASTNSVGTAGVDFNIRQPKDGSVGSVDVAIYGGAVLGAAFGIGTTQATGANALVAPL